MPAVKTRVLTAGLYFKKNELRLEILLLNRQPEFIDVLREGPSPRGAPSVPPFPISFSKKRLELKSLKGETKAEEEGPREPFLLSLRLPLKAL